jgi:hypothetical protein
MPQKDSISTHAKPQAIHPPMPMEQLLPTAPVLPHAVAKEYGLHRPAAGHALPIESPVDDNPLLVDGETNAAVDDIVARESDALLAAEDAARAGTIRPPRRGFWRRFGGFFAAWWRHKWLRYPTLLIVVGAVAGVSVVPHTRYATLNRFGVRSSASIVVVDTVTQLPLKNVIVQLGDTQAKTDLKGVARFYNLPLGPASLTIKRIAYAPQTQQLTIGWGSNPLGTYKLQGTGVQYVLYATDYFTGKPVEGAEVTSDEANAIADQSGKITLTVDRTDTSTLSVVLRAKNYREEPLTLHAQQEGMAPKAALTPLGREVYVSRQSGKYDVYSSDLDGKNTTVLLAGTGLESSNIALVTDPTGQQAALVSTRENVRDEDGYLQATLTLINVTEGTSSVIDRAGQIQLVDWVDGRLVYRAAATGTSAASDQRYRLIAYNLQTNNKVQLATANQFTAIISAQDRLYYATSSADPKANQGLYRVQLDGANKQKVVDQEIWTAVRGSFDTIYLQTPREWLLFTLTNDSTTSSTPPTAFTSHLYVRGPERNQFAWVDQRDGKGNLLLYDADGQKTTLVHTQEGLAQPLRWVNGVLVYRVATPTETADYAISLQGGEGRKITDLSASYGYSGGN